MNRNLIFISLFFISSNISSDEWIRVSMSDDRKSIGYINGEQVKYTDNYLYYWSMIEEKDNKSYRSVVAYAKADCDIGREQYLSISYYDDFKAKGNILNTVTPEGNWHYPIPGTTQMILHEVACNAKDKFLK